MSSYETIVEPLELTSGVIMLAKRVSKNVKSIRLNRDLSQKELAERSGLTVRYISRLENAPQNITLDVIERLANGLECDSADLLGKDTPNVGSSSKSKEARANIDEVIRQLKKLKSKI